MVGIPPVVDSDVEDVVWALQTAASLWKRNECADAIVWLRRAAQAAGDAEHDDRALALAREAAELSDWIAKNPAAASSPIDDTIHTSLSDILIEEAPQVPTSASAPVKPPVAAPAPPVAASSPPHAPTVTGDAAPTSEPSSVAVYQSVTSQRSPQKVQTAAEAHAGLLDPWAPTPEDEPRVVGGSRGSVVSSDEYDDDEVVTSAKMVVPPAIAAAATPAPAPHVSTPAERDVPEPPKKPPLPRPILSTLRPDDDGDTVTSAAGVSQASTPSSPPAPVVARPIAPPPQVAPTPSADATPSPSKTASSAPPRKPSVASRAPAEPTAPPSGKRLPAGEVDLSPVDALTDLPEDARAELERGATLHRLGHDEEIMGFALAYVVEGELDVAAQIVDAPADRIGEGMLLKAKGTVAESVPLRLVCASEHAVVATWDAAQVDPAFKSCPWVEDELRSAANRMQALVGVTLGPLAEKLDTTLRAQVTSRLDVRELSEGDVLVEFGEPVRELCLIGQGSIELVKDGAVIGEVAVGEFLFPAEIMGGGKASATARAGKGGALVLASARSVAQELMVTCPPLLEIFAGM